MKKIISLLVSIVMLLGMVSTVNAANELAGSKNYTLGSAKSGSIVEGNETDVYKFNLSTSGKISITFAGDMERAELKLYDAIGKELWNERPTWNSTTEEIRFTKELVLCKGEYYFSVSKAWGKWEGDYDFTITETAIYESFPEEQGGSNNSTKTANNINHGNEYIGCIAINDDADVYKFNLITSGKLTLNFGSDMERTELKLYDAMGKEIWNERPTWNSTTEEISYTRDLYLCKGDYYFSTSKSWGKCEGSYTFKFLFTSANESFGEEQNGSNNKLSAANMIDVNRQYTGFIALNDDVDIYKIHINTTKIELNLSANLERVDLKLYDETGKEIWNERPYWNSTTEVISYKKEIKLEPGAYYLSVSKSWGKCEGDFTFWFTDGGMVTITDPTPVIRVIVNGKYVQFDQPPIIDNERTLVPLRAIFEALGANVQWDGNTQTVTATKAGTVVVLQIGSTQMYVNGNVKVLDVPAKLINSRTLVPVRAISEALGCKVDWVQDSQTVVITQ